MSQDEAIAYIFCNYKDQGPQTAENLIASVLQQLSYKRLFVSNEISALYRFHTRRQTRPGLAEWLGILNAEVRYYAKVFLVIDAIDECAEAHGVRSDLLAELRALQPKMHLMVTSRPLLSLEREFKEDQRMEIFSRDEDIRLYLEKRLVRENRLSRLVEADPPLREVIITKILSAAKGV